MVLVTSSSANTSEHTCILSEEQIELYSQIRSSWAGVNGVLYGMLRDSK